MRHLHIIIPLVFAQFGFDFGDIGAALEGFALDAIGVLVAAVNFILSVLVSLGTYLLQALQGIFSFFRTLMEDIKRAFVWLWQNAVKLVLTKILAAYAKLRSLLAPIFNHVLLWLQKARALYDYIFRRFIRPYLIMIQHTRQVLQIFRLLGFKWAKRLDARLAAIEQKIVGVFLTIRAPLNQLISFIGLIADPLAILRRNPVIAAVLRDAPEIKNAIDRATAHTQTQAEVDKSNRANGWFQQPAVAGNARYFAQRQLPPDLAAARQEFIDAQAALPGLAKQGL